MGVIILNNSTCAVKKVSLNIIRIQKVTILLSIAALLFITSGCGFGRSTEVSHGNDSNNPPIINTGSVTISWDEPTTNSDGTTLTDLGGYNIYYGMSSGNYSNSVNLGRQPGATISNLSAGTWCFAVTSYDLSGNESVLSGDVCTVI